MKKILLLLAIVAVTLTAEAQESFKFGKVTKADLLKTDYPIAANADVVVLDECIQDGFFYSELGSIANTRMQRIISRKVKILSSDINFVLEIPFERNNLGVIRIFDFYAYHYSLLNGKITKQKFDNGNVVIEDIDKKQGVAKLEWPDVKVGDIIEFRYVVFYHQLGQSTDYIISGPNPILNSTYEAIVYKGYDIAINTFAYGNIPFKQTKVKDARIEYPDYFGDTGAMYFNYMSPSNSIPRFQEILGNHHKKSSVIYSFRASNIPANAEPSGVRVVLPADGIEAIRQNTNK